jgi:hypothetical protein
MKPILAALMVAFFMSIAIPSFAFNMYRVQCETLQGSGYVMVWFGDLEFKIPVECK